ncbi:MAG: hypothetical protein WCA42_01655, partial [Desulfobacterales bacterium]
MKKGLWIPCILMAVGLIQVSFGPTAAQAAEKAKKADLLFVQNAKDVTVDGKKLILKGIGPTVLFFSDRPERIAGHMTNERYLNLWREDGKDSFLADPPNATVSVFADDTEANLVVTLRNPQYIGDDLTYDISVLQGKLPEKGGPCSVFIDIIGMPLTPLSYAGVARRSV